jgi:putative RNA 2'-phosphotransferase
LWVTDEERQQRSRTISRWLRHHPEEAGLALSPAGWVGLDAVVEALEKRDLPTTREDLVRLAQLDAKPRFEIDEEKIRARYGHSVELEQAPNAGIPPSALFHGTSRRLLPIILLKGLTPRGKLHYVHLSPKPQSAREAGMKHDDEPIVLEIYALRAHEAGVKFYPRGKGVWLSDTVPPEFLAIREMVSADTEEGTRRSGPASGHRRRVPPKGGFLKKPDRQE